MNDSNVTQAVGPSASGPLGLGPPARHGEPGSTAAEAPNAELSRLHNDLQNLLVTAEMTALFLDRDLRIRRLTGGLASLLAAGPADIGRPLSDLADPDGGALAAAAAETLNSRQPVERELRGADGRWYLARLRPQNGPDGSLEGVLCTFIDITRLKSAEARSRSTAELFDIALDSAEMGWGTWDPETDIVELDARGLALMGFPPGGGRMLSRTWLDRLDPADREPLLAEWRAAAQEGRHAHYEYQIRLPDQSTRIVETIGAFVRGQDDQRPRWTGMLRDVTARRALEESLRRRTQMLALASKASGIGWGAYDPVTNLTDWDARGREIMGFSGEPDEYTEEGFLARVHPDDRERIAAELDASKAAGGDFYREYRIIRPNGEVRDIVGAGTYVRDESGAVLYGTGFLWDVTERKAQERALQRQAEMLRLASEAAGIGWATSDPAAGTARWDARAAEIFGYPPEPLTLSLTEVFNHIHPDDRDFVRSSTDANRETVTSFERDYRIIRTDAEVREVQARGVYVRDDDGATRGTGLIWDVTDRKEQERLIEERERTLRIAIQAARMAVWEWDMRHNALRVMVPMEGLPLPEPGGTLESQLETIHPEDHDSLLAAVRLLAEGNVPLGLELRNRQTDGAYRWMRAEGEIIRDEYGEPVRLLGVTIDIDAQKQSELALQRWAETLEERVAERTGELEAMNASLQAARERFHTLFEASPVPTVLLRLTDGVTLDANTAFLDYSGFGRDDVVGKNAATLGYLFDPDAGLSIFQIARRQGRLSGYEHQYTTPDGDRRTILLSIEPIEIDGQPCALGSHIDITDRKIAEEKVRELASELSLAEHRERQRVSAILHDDLQQRLYALQIQLTWLRDMLNETGGNDVQRALDDLMALVPDTVALTRRLSVDLSPPILQGEGLAEALAWLTSQMREQYGLQIEVHSRGRTRHLDEGLRILVFQVLRELLFNVVKHAGVSRVDVILSEHGDRLNVIVDDAGKGFDVDAVVSGRLPGGLGRGLATSRQRLELVGGGMTIRSAPDGGTTITISVPLPPRQEAGKRPSS